MRHLHSVVGSDEPLNMPWHTFLGDEPEYWTGKGERCHHAYRRTSRDRPSMSS
jgi:hypothetical protein